MTVANTFELNAREQKCRRVARQIILEAIGVTRTLTEDGWKELAERAEVNMPSEESRKRIIEMLGGLTE